ncbi:hypothetical protein NDU88_000557 [Pleurodeles waltl]|uniref:Uncharacterized protein n=1 Tax=Pleurodeles waltl TaxID=8319 RepID=A0AAV7N9Z3_PLEWA|nr:hypothetical protein NDU88_000557 [Pleurodeles waltl]
MGHRGSAGAGVTPLISGRPRVAGPGVTGALKIILIDFALVKHVSAGAHVKIVYYYRGGSVNNQLNLKEGKPSTRTPWTGVVFDVRSGAGRARSSRRRGAATPDEIASGALCPDRGRLGQFRPGVRVADGLTPGQGAATRRPDCLRAEEAREPWAPVGSGRPELCLLGPLRLGRRIWPT